MDNSDTPYYLTCMQEEAGENRHSHIENTQTTQNHTERFLETPGIEPATFLCNKL